MALQKLPIILDSDPGFDDALAIFLLYKYKDLFDIKLFCSTAGNTPIEKTTRNLQFFAKNFFKGVKLAKGLANPLVKSNPCNAENVHGMTGLGDFDPGEQKYPYKEDSAIAMYDVLRKSKIPVTIISLGPMTNIARLLVMFPDIKNKISEIYAMIGSVTGHGNITPFAEFNSYFDPEAFDLVAKSGIPITFNTIELGEHARVARDKILSKPIHSQMGSVIKTMMRGSCEICDESSLFLYDVNTIYPLIRPDLYSYVNCDVQVFTDKENNGKCIMTKNPKSNCCYQVVKNITKLNKAITDDLFGLE